MTTDELRTDNEFSRYLDISILTNKATKYKMNSSVTIERRSASKQETNSKSFIPPNTKADLYYYRGIRTDVSLVPPIRQTASIFKQPVTVIKNHEPSKIKHDPKYQDKPKQLFWEKRLEGMRACNISGEEFSRIELPKGMRAVGPNVYEQTVLQSVATALHISNQPVTGQIADRQVLLTNSGVYINPEQPLMQAINVSDDDIRRQEDRVIAARRRLQDALKG